MNTFNWCKTDWIPHASYGNFHEGQPWMWFDADQVWYDGNELALHIEKNPTTIHHHDGNTYHPQFGVGLIRSAQSFGYGTFSAEIQLPKGKNLWPAFWLVGEGEWPDNGEIDIMEAWSNRNGSYYRFPLSWKVTSNIHYQDNGHKQVGQIHVSMLKLPKNPTEHFVKYEVEWRKDFIKFKVNGKVVETYGYCIAKRMHDTRQHVIFDLWTTGLDYSLETPMMIRNFTYKPIEIL